MIGQRGIEITLESVIFSYAEMQMMFDFTITSSQIATIIGPSGSGKSTLLNLIAGFETPQSGRILINGLDMTAEPPAARPISMIFQENNLFPHLNIEENIGLGRSPQLKLSGTDHTAIADAIARVGLSGKEKRKPETLSGGERQRAAIARALVRNRPGLLLDEAFSSLGPALRIQMLDLVRHLYAEIGMTIIKVTHHPEDALHLSSFLYFLEEGRISAKGLAKDMLSKNGPHRLKQYIGTEML